MNENNKPWYIIMLFPITVGIICVVAVLIALKLWY